MKKFRAWYIEKKVMAFDDEEIPSDVEYWDGVQSCRIGLLNHLLNDEDYKLMQFTGRKDKNKVDIYEGDIVHLFYNDPIPKPHVIVWHEYSCRFMAVHVSEYNKFLKGDDIYFANTGSFPHSFGAIVVGNIHQHPQLLQQ